MELVEQVKLRGIPRGPAAKREQVFGCFWAFLPP